EGRDPFDDWVKINDELRLYNAKLADRPQIVAANKMDMPDAEVELEWFLEKTKAVNPDIQVMPISSLTRQGVPELLYKVADLLDSLPEIVETEAVAETTEEGIVYRYEGAGEHDFTITRDNDVYVVNSESIEKLMKRTQFASYEAVIRFGRILRSIGV